MSIPNRCMLPPMTIGMIPTSYLESMTYLEQILCINKKLCEIIDYLQTISIENIEDMINKQIEIVKDYVDNQDEILYNKVNEEMNIQVNLLKELINQKVLFLIDYVNNSQDVLKNQILEKLEELKNEINDIIINGIDVYDPTTGKYDNIQEVVYNLYKYLRYYGITAIAFDNLGLTAQNFDNKKMTARVFDLYSKCKLVTDFNHMMFSPFDGELTPLSTVINQLATLHKNELTAIEFDNLDLTTLRFRPKRFDSLSI